MDAVSEALAGRKAPVRYWFRFWVTDINGTRTTEITESVISATVSLDNDRDCVRTLALEMRDSEKLVPFRDHIQPVMYLRTFQTLPPDTLTEVVEEFPLGIFATDFSKRKVGTTGDTLTFPCNDLSIHLLESTVVSESVNEIQRVAIPARITGGTYRLTFNGQQTGTIARNATAATVKTALEALSNIAVNDVTVTGAAGGPYTIEFVNALGNAGHPQMTGQPTGLTPTTANPAVVITTIRQGGAGAGYTVPAGTEYAIGAVGDILERQGYAPEKFLLPSGTTQTPQDFTWPPGTTWLEIINDLLDGVNCHHLWFDRWGFATSREREIMSEQQGDIAYASDRSSIILSEPTIEENRESVFNQVTCVSGDPSYQQVSVIVTNNNPASPFSVPNLDGRTIALPNPVEFPKIFDAATLESRCVAELEKVSAENGETVAFTTVIDPRRKPHEFYKLNLYAGRNEVQRLRITGSPTGGVFTLEFDGETTTNLNWNATPKMIEDALEVLITIGPGNIKVWGGPLPAYAVFIEFVGTRSATNMPLIKGADTMTGGSSPTVVINEEQRGLGRGRRIQGIYRVKSWAMPLKVGAAMTHVVQRVSEVT